MIKQTLLFCAAATGLAAINASASVISLNATSGSGWVAILPPSSTPNNSYPSSSPIGNVGLAWEAGNTGWNSNAAYNASGWNPYTWSGWSWINGTGETPFYGRNVININGTVNSATFSLGVDDDSQVWVNGIMVINDNNMGFNGTHTANIASYLHSGLNVIAFKAHNSAGGGFGVSYLGGSIDYTPGAVPVPGTLFLLLSGLAGFGALRRKG